MPVDSQTNSTNTPIGVEKASLPKPVADPELDKILSQTGQIGVKDINRRFYGNAYLNNVVEAAKPQELPTVQPLNVSNFDLEVGQKQYIEQASTDTANQANTIISALQNQYANQILPTIQSNVQDQAVLSGQMTGELGVPVETSTRAASFIGNAQAIGQQQIQAAYKDYSTQVAQAANQAQANQTAILGKAVEMEQSNRAFDFQQAQFDFSKDQFLTGALGTLFQGGEDTGLQTLAGQQSQLQTALGTETLRQAQFNNDILMDENGNPTDIGQAYIDSLGLGYELDATQKQATLRAFQEFSTETSELQGLLEKVASGDPDAIKAWAKAQDEEGNGYGIYWLKSPTPTINKDGSVTRDVIFDEDALSQKGLFLNVNFNSEAYRQATANMKDGTRPDQLFSQQVLGAIQRGETPEILNKIGVESNDGNVTLLALKNTGGDGTKGYVFKAIDLTGRSDEDKFKIRQELLSIDPRDPKILEKVTSVLEKQPPNKNGQAVSKTITSQEYMDYLMNDSYSTSLGQNLGVNSSGEKITGGVNVNFSNARLNRISDNLPRVPQLLAGIFAGMAGENIYPALVQNRIIDSKDGFSTINLQNEFTVGKQANLDKLSAGGIRKFNTDTAAIDRAVKLYNGNAVAADFGSIDPSTYQAKTSGAITTYAFDPGTKSILQSLAKTKDVMKINIKDEDYLNDAFTAFLMGAFVGVDREKASGLNKLINQLPVI
jgi:hypothetical protein